MSGVWMQTITGDTFEARTPHVEPVDLFTVVAPVLARIPRFGGHTIEAFSVAQHCVLCAEAAEDETGDLELAAHCLLLDAPKAYVGDILQPTLAALLEQMVEPYDKTTIGLVRDQRTKHLLGSLQRNNGGIATEIERAAGLSIEGHIAHRAAAKAIDLRALRTERDDLMAPGRHPWRPDIEAAPRLPIRTGRIRPLPEREARGLFIATLERLCPAIADANPARP